MKKIITLLLITFFVISYSASTAQTTAAVQKNIEQANIKFMKWFNAGQADSIVAQYHVNACITDRGCGKPFLQNHFATETGKYKFKELATVSVTVKDNTAEETGRWKILLGSGMELSGRYQTEWQKVNNKWVIFKETIIE